MRPARAPEGIPAARSDSETRERLVAAAVEVFLDKGYGGTRVADIADRAGYTAGALYVHFPSRTALLGEAILREGRRIIGTVVDELADVAPGDGRVAARMAEQATAPVTRMERLLLEALALATRSPEASRFLGASLAELDDLFARHIDRAASAGLLDPNLDRGAVKHFFSVWFLGTVVHRALGLPGADAPELAEVCGRQLASLLPQSDG